MLRARWLHFIIEFIKRLGKRDMGGGEKGGGGEELRTHFTQQ